MKSAILHIMKTFFKKRMDDKIDQKNQNLNQFRSHKPTLSFKPS